MKQYKSRYPQVGLLLLLLGLKSIGVSRVQGHGRLVEPPSRASAWRYGFSTEKDYNDSESYCGGWSRQHQRNSGKCGVCGDAWDLPTPRAHEHGGRYGNGVIVRTYKTNAEVEIGVELTANHQGYFEFRLCAHNMANAPETDECFDRHLLIRADASADDLEGHRYRPGPGSNIVFRSFYKLPEGLTCDQCVLQWRYVAGNNWGNCPNGTGMVGCGPQEQFRGCADVKITLDGIPDVPTDLGTTNTTVTTTQKPRTRGTVTSRYTRPTTSTEASLSSSTASAVEVVTKSTTDSTAVQPNAGSVDASSNPGPYAGIIIALATLLLAIILVCGTILYFHSFHQGVKAFVGARMRRSAVANAPACEHKAPLKLPASVFAQHQPPEVTGDTKPPVPPRIRHNDIRQLSLTISEPLDVCINGIFVSREDAGSPSPSAILGSERNVSVA